MVAAKVDRPVVASTTETTPTIAPDVTVPAGTVGDTPVPKATPVTPTTAETGTSTNVDVAAVLEQAVSAKGEKLDWRHSIVDLMKALDLDSSLAARKELAQELNYPGDSSDSAAMNTWLHKALMMKLAQHGGTIPAELRD